MIYLNNSATSMFKPQCVIDGVVDYLKHSGNPGRGVNKASLESGSIVYDTRVKIAEFYNFDNPNKVIFTSGVTESSNTIINSVVKSEDHIITSYLDHNATLRPLYHSGCQLSITDGTLEEIKKCVKSNTKAVFLNHCSNVTGEIQDISAIGKFCRENKILFVADCAQSSGVVNIDMQKSNIDILCFTGHKSLMGMQGIGGMLINTDIEIEPLKRGGTGMHSFDKDMPVQYPEHLEAGTINVPGIVSLNASLDYINSIGVENIYKHELELRQQLLDYFSTKSNVKVYKNDNKPAIGIASFNYKDVDPAKISDYLSNEYDICIRSGAHCAPLVLEHYGIDSCARVSIGYKNTKSDIDTLISALDNM